MSTYAAAVAVQWEEAMASLQKMLADEPDQVLKWKAEVKRRSLQTGVSLLHAADSVLRDVSRGERL